MRLGLGLLVRRGQKYRNALPRPIFTCNRLVIRIVIPLDGESCIWNSFAAYKECLRFLSAVLRCTRYGFRGGLASQSSSSSIEHIC